MATSIEVTGLRETVRSLEKLGVEVSDLKAAFKRIGGLVVTDAQALAPKLTGRLAASIKPSNTKNKSIVRAGGGGIPYAGVIHYGGYHGISPHPFLTQALSRNQSDVISTLDKELQGLIRRLDLN